MYSDSDTSVFPQSLKLRGSGKVAGSHNIKKTYIYTESVGADRNSGVKSLLSRNFGEVKKLMGVFGNNVHGWISIKLQNILNC